MNQRHHPTRRRPSRVDDARGQVRTGDTATLVVRRVYTRAARAHADGRGSGPLCGHRGGPETCLCLLVGTTGCPDSRRERLEDATLVERALCADVVELMMACVSWHAAALTERVRPGVGAWQGVSGNGGDGMGRTTLR